MKITQVPVHLKSLYVRDVAISGTPVIVNGTKREIDEIIGWVDDMTVRDTAVDRAFRYGGTTKTREEKYNLYLGFDNDADIVAMMLRWG